MVLRADTLPVGVVSVYYNLYRWGDLMSDKNKLKCCKWECEENAVYEIKCPALPLCYSHACAKHLSDMLYEGVNTVYAVDNE